MRVLVIGGSGLVGGLTLPYLTEQHELRVYDLRPPTVEGVEYVHGNVVDAEAITHAAEGCDALLYMAMGRFDKQSRSVTEADAFEVNVKGVYVALAAAHRAGISHAVYTSSLSTYHGKLEDRDLTDEDIPPDARDLYGFTKRLGEEVCRNAYQRWGMSVNALRLCWPLAPEKWHQAVTTDMPLATRADDVARALDAALNYQGGFNAFFISGDWQNKHLRMAKAKRLLGWEPLARPEGVGTASTA